MMSTARGSEFTSNHVVSVKNRLLSLFQKKSAIAAIYAGVFMIVVAVISVGYYSPQESSVKANATNLNSFGNTDKPSVDDVVATEVAATVAQSVNMPISNNVANLAVSTQVKNELAQSDSISTAKPQIISSSYENKSVINYTVKDGDTVNGIAKKYNISAQTVKWVNDMTDSDTIDVGDAIKILPVNGVLYSVKSGDTIDSIAKKYKTDKTRLISYNDLEVSGLKPNTSIILPNGVLPDYEMPGYVTPITYYGFVSNGNTYAYGNCTWYAYQRRMQLGNPVSSGLGHATTWDDRSSSGYNHKPSVGAVLVEDETTGNYGYGHVAIVESVDLSGNVIVSEMNNYAYGGWNIISRRTISAGQAVLYKYIH